VTNRSEDIGSSDKKQTVNFNQVPDARGHFGPYGGRFVSETLIYALDELESIYRRLKDDPKFQAEFDYDLAHYVGRPSPLYFAERWTKETGGAQLYLKREDLNHTGAHKINNTIGQALLAKHTGKKTYYCGNRCRSTWCGNSNCGGTPGIGLSCFYG